MHITTVHIPAILALIAGILILVMPRLLNLVVAIYLICVGVIDRSAEITSHLALARRCAMLAYIPSLVSWTWLLARSSANLSAIHP